MLNPLSYVKSVELDTEQIVDAETVWHLVLVIGLDLACQSLLCRGHGPRVALIFIQGVVKDVVVRLCEASAEQ